MIWLKIINWMLSIANHVLTILLQTTEQETPLPVVMYSRNPLELEEEDGVAPIEAEEPLPGTGEDPSPTVILARVLGTLEPEREVAKSEPDEDGEGSSTTPIDEVAENRTMKKI